MEISDIKSRLTLAEVIKHYGFKADKQNRINCPFHPDKTPSLQLYYKTHTCYCFSSNCPTHGKSLDVIDFIMHMEKCSKHEAILKAAAMINGTAVNKGNAEPLTKMAILTKMFTYFKNAVHNSPPAKEYLEKRTLDYTKLEIGYNTGQFHHGIRRDEALIKSCLQVGLLSGNDRLGRTGEPSYKPFAKLCIVFALRNKAGQITGLYFRSTINDQEQRHFYLKDREGLYPKYPEPNTKKIILTESIIDAATLQQQEGIIYAERGRSAQQYSILALYGTNGLTEEHTAAITELKQVKEIIFFLDGDEAGRAAVKKHSETLHKLLPQITISNIEPPEGEDVNSLLQACTEQGRSGHSPELFTELINKRTFLFSDEKENPPTHETMIKSTEPEQQAQASALQSPPSGGQKPSGLLSQPEGSKGLDTRNKEQIHYHTKELLITLLGGASLHNLDRLVVTLYLRRNPHINAQYSIRQRVDLYQDDMTEKFIRRAAEKLEISTTYISKAIAELTEDLEAWRMKQAELQQMQAPKRKELNQQEREQAIKALKRKDLMQFTQESLGMTGIVGEEKNRLIMYLIMTSRKRERPLHILSLGSSGSGKTHLQEQVGECIPEEDKLEITIMSDNAFYYFTREELKNVLILIEDLHGAQTVLYPLRELQTKQRITKTVTLKDKKGNLKTVQLVVEGPVSIAGCTTQERIYEDNASRSFLIYIDESREQEEKVMEHQRKESAGLIHRYRQQEMKEQLKNMQRMLKPIRVRNPYAMELRIPEKIFKPRRTNAHYLQFIETISFYHQYQREIKTDRDTGEKYIETTVEDIAWANRLITEVLLRKSDELSGACRNFFEALKAHLQKRKETVPLSATEGRCPEFVEGFYAKEIRQALGLSIDKVKKYLIELGRNGYIKITGGNKYKTGFEYQVNDYEEYHKLKEGICNVLEELLEKIKNKEPARSGSIERSQNAAAEKQLVPIGEITGNEINVSGVGSAEVVRNEIGTTQAMEYQVV